MNDGKPEIWHVYPLNDWRLHDTHHGSACWFRPRIEEDGQLIIHNSMDERETHEEGRKLQ